jgi:EmrB/QacA subfamily drug resistance transporter
MTTYQKNSMMGLFLTSLLIALVTETFLNNALYAVMQTFSVSSSVVHWLSSLYILVLGLMIPTSAFVFYNFSTKWIYTSMMGLFAVGSLICLISPNFYVLLFGRALQAIVAGVLVPLVQNVVLAIYDKNRRPFIFGLVGMVVAIGPAIGPVLSGFVLHYTSFRSLFLIVLLLSLVLLGLGIRFVFDISPHQKRPLDFWSLCYSTVGFGLLLLSFSLMGEHQQVDFLRLGMLVIGIIALIIFCRRQFKISHYLMNLAVLKNRTFTASMTLASICNFSLLGVELVIPLYLQQTHNLDALTTGLVLLPGSLLLGVISPFSGKLYQKFGYQKLAIVGFSILILATLPYLMIESLSLVAITIFYMIRIGGLGLVLIPSLPHAMAKLPQSETVDGNAVFSTIREIAAALGMTVLMTLLALSHFLSFVIAIVIAAIGLLIALFFVK